MNRGVENLHSSGSDGDGERETERREKTREKSGDVVGQRTMACAKRRKGDTEN